MRARRHMLPECGEAPAAGGSVGRPFVRGWRHGGSRRRYRNYGPGWGRHGINEGGGGGQERRLPSGGRCDHQAPPKGQGSVVLTPGRSQRRAADGCMVPGRCLRRLGSVAACLPPASFAYAQGGTSGTHPVPAVGQRASRLHVTTRAENNKTIETPHAHKGRLCQDRVAGSLGRPLCATHLSPTPWPTTVTLDGRSRSRLLSPHLVHMYAWMPLRSSGRQRQVHTAPPPRRRLPPAPRPVGHGRHTAPRPQPRSPAAAHATARSGPHMVHTHRGTGGAPLEVTRHRRGVGGPAAARCPSCLGAVIEAPGPQSVHDVQPRMQNSAQVDPGNAGRAPAVLHSNTVVLGCVGPAPWVIRANVAESWRGAIGNARAWSWVRTGNGSCPCFRPASCPCFRPAADFPGPPESSPCSQR